MPRESEFQIGDRVYDKREQKPVTATLIEMRRHTNGSPKWLCQYPEGRFWVWEIDLKPAAEAAGVK